MKSLHKILSFLVLFTTLLTGYCYAGTKNPISLLKASSTEQPEHPEKNGFYQWIPDSRCLGRNFRRCSRNVNRYRGIESNLSGAVEDIIYTPSKDLLHFVEDFLPRESAGKAPDLDQFIQEAGQFCGLFGTECNMISKIYTGVSSRELYRHLLTFAESLAAGYFLHKNGTASAVISGPSGIGKTVAYQTFVNLIPHYFPKIVPVYVTFDTFKNTDWEKHTLIEKVQEVLEARIGLKVSGREFGDIPGFRMFHALEEADQYLFLIVDDFDKLYKEDPDNRQAIRILDQIKIFGMTTSGRVACLLNYSTTLAADLVEGEGPKDRFPLLKEPRNLNSTKFRTFEIPMPVATDLKAARLIYGEGATQEIRSLLFERGNTFPRKFGEMNPRVSLFLRHILQEMWKKNKQLLSQDLSILHESDWENTFIPIKLDRAKEIWKKAIRQHSETSSASSDVKLLLDEGHLGYQGKLLFPQSLRQIVNEHNNSLK